jgi:hypothetical protein
MLRIKEDGTTIQASQVGNPNGSVVNTRMIQRVRTPSAGSRTVKLTGQRASGTGTNEFGGDAGNLITAFLLVEDIGPNGAPA